MTLLEVMAFVEKHSQILTQEMNCHKEAAQDVSE